MQVEGDTTVRDALAAFRRENGIPTDAASRAWWSCRIGPLRLWLPNFRWRRHAILAHDLHHVLVGFPCTMRGECLMAAWEFGAGRMPHPAAALFCLPLVLLGCLWSPRRTWDTFLLGRHSSSLHDLGVGDGLLDSSIGQTRDDYSPRRRAQARASDYVRFAQLVLGAALILLLPAALLAAMVV